MSSPKAYVVLALLFFCWTVQYAEAQDNPSPEEVVPADTTLTPTFVPLDVLVQDEIPPGEGFEMQKSPIEAMWRSAVLPGWGQLYVESYWKAPLFFGGAVALGVVAFWNNGMYNEANREFEAALAAGEPTTIPLQRREFFRDNRDQSAFYLLAVFILSVVDAYAGAHLYDMPTYEKNDLSFDLAPMQQGGIRLNIAWHL